jgi:hypothetical protein
LPSCQPKYDGAMEICMWKESNNLKDTHACFPLSANVKRFDHKLHDIFMHVSLKLSRESEKKEISKLSPCSWMALRATVDFFFSIVLVLEIDIDVATIMEWEPRVHHSSHQLQKKAFPVLVTKRRWLDIFPSLKFILKSNFLIIRCCYLGIDYIYIYISELIHLFFLSSNKKLIYILNKNILSYNLLQ